MKLLKLTAILAAASTILLVLAGCNDEIQPDQKAVDNFNKMRMQRQPTGKGTASAPATGTAPNGQTAAPGTGGDAGAAAPGATPGK